MINLISKDLRKEEVYIQIADCLDYLEKLTFESFNKVTEKLNLMNDDLIKIEQRREIVKSKIDQIKKNNNKAIRIHSPFYYPAKEIKDQYNYESSINSSQLKLNNSNQNYKIKQSFELFHPDDLNEMLNFCDLETFLKTERESINFLNRQKLNKSTIPWNRIKSISSLIIFNSSETAYIKTDQELSIYDFKTVNKQKKIEEDNELNFGKYAPPKSMISKKDKFASFEQNLFTYDTQEAPKVLDNLPNDLPNLGAVADDIFFKEDERLIPFTNVHINEEKDEDNTNRQLPSKLVKIFSFDQSSTSSIEETKPKESKKSNDLKETTVSQTIPLPPPLPNFDTNLSSFESSNEIEQKKPIEKKPIVNIDNSRANLLDAIRKAGGKPDKSKTTIKEKKLEERKNRKESVSTDLMSDLKKHLMSRRHAMVGAKLDKLDKLDSKSEVPKKDSANVYKTMTEMIPSPESSEQSDSEIDEDWIHN